MRDLAQTVRIGILTSGGDAPGMNAAIRAAVRSADERGWSVLGIEDGFAGLFAGQTRSLGPRDVGGIIHRGGTILGSARYPGLATEAGMGAAIAAFRGAELDALVVIGGNGSQTGAHALSMRGLPVVGIASTIDNDLLGCDVSIGSTSAVDVALEAIDRLKTTASSHHRAFLVEVMGRGCGYIALAAGIAGGAEAIALPEIPSSVDEVPAAVRAAYRRGQAHAIVVVAEGIPGGADGLAERLHREPDAIGFDARVVKLGHVQRGAAPGSFDRILASRTGSAAIDAIARGTTGVMIGVAGGAIVETPLAVVANQTKGVSEELFELSKRLAR